MQLSIVGMGRIGRVIARRAEAQGHLVTPVMRAGGAPAPAGPIVLAVGEDDLDAAAARFAPADGPRLLFVQNGLLVDVMARFPGAGRGLLHFNADAEGRVRVLMTSVFGGEAGEPVARVLHAGGIPSRHEPDAVRLRVEEIRKLLWSTVLSALAVAERLPVGRLPVEREAPMDALARECIAVAAAALGLAAPPVPDVLASLRVMAAALPDYAGSARGQRFRNRLLVDMGRRLGIPTPRNEEVLAAIGASA